MRCLLHAPRIKTAGFGLMHCKIICVEARCSLTALRYSERFFLMEKTLRGLNEHAALLHHCLRFISFHAINCREKPITNSVLVTM